MSRSQFLPTDPTAADLVNNPDLRARLGYGVLDVLSSSGIGFEDVHRYSSVGSGAVTPRAKANRLRRLLGRALTEKEALATWSEITQYQNRQVEAGRQLSFEDATREWDEKHGFAFRRRWFLTRPEPGERQYVPGGRERGPTPVGRAAGLVLPELRPLLEAGFSVTDVLTHAAREPLPSAKLALRRVPRRERNNYYVRLVADLTGWSLSEEEAERVWEEALKHKADLSDRVGHNVPMDRALVDYFKRLRLSGLDRVSLWELGQSFAPNSGEEDPKDARSTEAGALFPA